MPTPLGEMRLVASASAKARGVVHRPGAAAFVRRLAARRIESDPGTGAARAGGVVRQDRRVFEVALDPVGTPFQHEVWRALCALDFGVLTSYGELARTVGRPGGAGHRRRGGPKSADHHHSLSPRDRQRHLVDRFWRRAAAQAGAAGARGQSVREPQSQGAPRLRRAGRTALVAPGVAWPDGFGDHRGWRARRAPRRTAAPIGRRYWAGCRCGPTPAARRSARSGGRGRADLDAVQVVGLLHHGGRRAFRAQLRIDAADQRLRIGRLAERAHLQIDVADAAGGVGACCGVAGSATGVSATGPRRPARPPAASRGRRRLGRRDGGPCEARRRISSAPMLSPPPRRLLPMMPSL